MKFIDLAGTRVGRLTIVERSPNKGRRTQWVCQCSCGTTKVIGAEALRAGTTVSCGCFHKERQREVPRTHGMFGKPEYRIWNAMWQRCTNPKNKEWSNYGGRGIAVCERWRLFGNFYADMGPRPSNKYSVDRINNNKDYAPFNCRWATWTEQANNRRKPRNGQQDMKLSGAAK